MKTPAIAILATVISATLPLGAQEKKPLGYQDTPLIPGTNWHVHDGLRPQPKVVTPGEFGTQEKASTVPSDAVVLFDGKDFSKWRGKDGDAKWKVEGEK